MLTVFFYFQGLVHIEFLERGGVIDSDQYILTLGSFKEKIRRKRPNLWIRNAEGYRSFLLHQDNAPVHVSAPTLGKFGEWGIELLPHPPYSPDLAPCDYALFPKLKEQLRGRRFRTLHQLQTATKDILNSFDTDFFEETIADLVTRWKKCVAVDGDYFEGEHIQVDLEDFGEDSDTDSEEEPDDPDGAN